MATDTQNDPPGEGMEEVRPQVPDVEQSYIDKLRARRTAIANEKTKVFDLPGYDGLLKATYKRLGYEEVMKIVRRVARTDDAQVELGATIDFLIRSCVSIDGHDGTHISDGFNMGLAEFFDFHTERMRDVVQHVIPNDLAITAHQMTVLRWMQSGEEAVMEDFQGE